MKLPLAIGAAVAAIALAPQASATPDIADFIDAVHADGIKGTPNQIINDGFSVCQYMATHNGLEAAHALSNAENLRLDLAEAFVIDAAHYLCPEFEPHGSHTTDWIHPTPTPAPVPHGKVPVPALDPLSDVIHDTIV
jgi:hypothetical protein